MKNDQQTVIDPILFAQLSKSISGELSFSQFHRFGKLAKFDGKDVNYLLSFFYDEEKRCCINGKSKVTVKLKCNRCLSLFSYEIETIFRLYPVEGHDINRLSKQLDVVVMENGLISLIDVIEDELILSLPEVPKHAYDDPSCRSLLAEWSQEDNEQQENPFVVLKSLHKTNGKGKEEE
jgi:uncharacterized protein